MKLKATDTVHITAVQSDPLFAGDEFEVDDEAGQSLIERGLATEVPDKPAPKPKGK